jgi:hypothetical protein
MPTQTTSTPTAATTDRTMPPQDESPEGRSAVPAVVLGAVVALSYTFLVGTFVGHVI